MAEQNERSAGGIDAQDGDEPVDWLFHFTSLGGPEKFAPPPGVSLCEQVQPVFAQIEDGDL